MREKFVKSESTMSKSDRSFIDFLRGKLQTVANWVPSNSTIHLTPPRTQLLSRAEKSSLIINQRGWADERRKKAEKERKTVKRASSRTKDFITHQTTNLRPSLFGRRLLSSNSRNRETSDGHTKYRFPPLFILSFSRTTTIGEEFCSRWPLYDSSTRLGGERKLEQCATASRNKSSNDLFIQIKLTSQSFSCIMEYLRAYCFRTAPSQSSSSSSSQKAIKPKSNL